MTDDLQFPAIKTIRPLLPLDQVSQEPWLLDPALDATVTELRILGVDL